MLGKWFHQHILGFFLCGKANSKLQFTLYTGIFLGFRDHKLWLTAGHVLDEILHLLGSNEFEPSMVRWVDRYDGADNAKTIPIAHHRLAERSKRSDRLDLAVIELSSLEVKNILSQSNKKLMGRVIWENLEDDRPEGYYIVGYPRDSYLVPSNRVNQAHQSNQFKAYVFCIPISLTKRSDLPLDDDFFSDRNALYGRIVESTPGYSVAIDSIKGLSGGPLFSVERVGERIKFKLHGITRSWRRSDSYVRIEPVSRVIDELTEWFP